MPARTPEAARPARRRRLACLALTLLGSAFAAEDSALQPLPEDSPLAGRLGAIGMLLVGDEGQFRGTATGFLVSACHVLTAAHALARAGERVPRGLPVRFVPATGARAYALTPRAVWGQVVAADPDFVAKAVSSHLDLQTVAADWALIELERPLPQIEPFKLLYPGAVPAADAVFSVAGYAASGQMRFLYAHENCRNRQGFHGSDRYPGVLVADCAVREGMSGGPVLIDAGRQLIAAGIVVERFETGARVMTVAVPTSAFAERVSPAMRASRVCAVGQPFVLAPAPDSRPAKP